MLRVYEDGRQSASDQSLFVRAVELNRLFFTHDEDLLCIGTEWQAQARPFPGIVYVHQAKFTIGRQIETLLEFTRLAPTERVANQIIYLPWVR